MHMLPRAYTRGTLAARLRAHFTRPGPFPVVTLILLVCLSQLAFAGTDPPPPDQDAAGWLQALYTAVTQKQWGIVAGVALIGLVYPLRLWGPNVVKTKLGGLILAFVVSLAGTLGITLAAGAAVSIQVVIGAITTSATAAGLWEWIKTHLPGGAKAAAAAVAKNPGSAMVSLVVALIVVIAPVAQIGCAASQ